MKRFTIYLAALAALLAYTSCEKPEPDGPDTPDTPAEVTVTFPSLVENYEVSPGETLTLTFTPAKDWTISVPSDNLRWYWIADGTFKVDKFSGKASKETVTVKIGVSETEEFDTNRSCDVTLTIGDESKVIAKYMRPAKERTLSLYTAELDEAGDYKLAEDGVSYVYGTEEASAVALVWSASNADFRAPVRIESNGEWTVTYPDWLTVNVPEKTAGVTEIILTGSSLEDVSGKIAFKSGENVIKEFEVTLPSCKGVDVYSAVYEDDEFKFADEGGYLWTEETVEEFSLVWLGSDFRMPISVSSKCEWTLSLPDWLSAELPETTAGDVSFTVLGVPSKYPLEDATGKMVFKYGDDVIHEVEVTIPGCKDIMTYSLGMALTALDFNAAGEVMTSTGYADVDVTATLFGTSDVSVAAFESVGGKYVTDKAPEWMTLTVSNFNTSDGASVLQEREVKISVTENTSDERSAVLLFLPGDLKGKAASVFTEDKTSVKEEYKKYAVSVSQLSNEFTISMNSSEATLKDEGVSFETMASDNKAELTAVFGETDQVYVLSYAESDNIYVWENAKLLMSRSFASVKIYDADKEEHSGPEYFWLSFTSEEEQKSGYVKMYVEDLDGNLPPLPKVSETGYVVFYDESETALAIIECISPFEEPYLKVSKPQLIFEATPSEDVFKIETNVASWSIECDSEWCKVSPGTGEGSKDVTVTVDENPSTTEIREAVITITSEELAEAVHVKVKQGQGAEYLDEFKDISRNFVDRSVISDGAELKRLESGPTYDAMAEEISQGAEVWYLTVPRLNYEVEIKLPNRYLYYQMPYLSSGEYHISVNGENYANTRGQLTNATDKAKIILKSLPENDSYVKVVRFHLSSSNTYPFLVLFVNVKE